MAHQSSSSYDPSASLDGADDWLRAGKLEPPALPAPFIARHDVEARLAAVLDRRLAIVVAGAGFGKTTLVAAWAAGVPSAWYTLDAGDAALPRLFRGLAAVLAPSLGRTAVDLLSALEAPLGPAVREAERADALTASLCQALEDTLADDLVLVFDDVHEAGAFDPVARVIEGLCRQAPPRLHVVLISRDSPPFRIERLRGRGQVVEIDASAMAFSPEDVEALLRAALPDATDLAAPLHAVTGGWPAAVRLAVEALRVVEPDGRPAVLARLGTPDGPLYGYLAEEVFATLPDPARELIRRLAPFPRFTEDLCAALDIAGAAELLGHLARAGLVVQPGRDPRWFAINRLVRHHALSAPGMTPSERAEIHRRAATWFEATGQPEAALDAWAAVPDDAAAARVLREQGPAMLGSGSVEAVLRAIESLSEAERDAAIEELAGEGYKVRGDWERALACFGRAAGETEELPAGLAWRMGVIHYLRGDAEAALEVYRRGRFDRERTDDEALLLAWTATVHWVRGDEAACADNAVRALAAAEASGDGRALAASHTSLALLAALRGDRHTNAEHYRLALAAAEAAGDVLHVVRIRTNRASHLNEEGWYERALDELDVAIGLAEVAGYAAFVALAHVNRAEARFRLGLLDEAVADFERSRDTYRRIGSLSAAYPLGGLGDVYLERGNLVMARAAYEEALVLGERSADVQALVPALAGLARVLLDDDPGAAEAAADRAVSLGTGLSLVRALLARGWVALARGDVDGSRDRAHEAAELSRGRRDRAGLAESLELMAAADRDAAAGLLEEAVTLWRDLRNPLREASCTIALARVQPGGGDPSTVEAAQRRLRDLGVRPRAAGAAGILAVTRRDPPPVSIRTLGGFQVVRDGSPVPQTVWQSKKARDLLKILVARRGRPVPREFLIEALWPDDDPEKTSNRLSVALSTVRAVLDPDRRSDPDDFVTADRETVRLNVERVPVDVEAFLLDADAGDTPAAGQARDAARVRHARAEAAYAGDFLEEDPYEDWAIPLREQARAAYVRVTRSLAESASASGDHDTAIRYLLRVLEHDAYDEDGHLGLVTALVEAGRHGEARRMYGGYVRRMDELGVEPAPFPAVGRGGTRSGSGGRPSNAPTSSSARP